MHYLFCKESSIKALEEEIRGTLTTKLKVESKLNRILLDDSVDLRNRFCAFSTAAVINGQSIPEDSISKQAQQTIELIRARIEDGSKINLHVFSATESQGIIETGRAEILKDKLRTLLKAPRIFPLRKNFDRSIGFVQVMIQEDRSLAVSVIPASEMVAYYSLISPFPGGFTYGEENKDAPSRAFRKLVEAQEILCVSMTENDQVIDLGACPGGWTYVARRSGASVIALDRSPLREDLMADEKVMFVKADAFKYIPEVTIDWAVSDIICTPDRVMELMEYWVLEKNCTNFVFTIKFHGDENYNVVETFKNVAPDCDFHVIIKQLNANKNEVTIMGSRK